jgi:hypothetical protein
VLSPPSAPQGVLTLRIGFGEFDWPDGSGKKAYLRTAFLRVLGEQTPEVWNNLHNRVFRLYTEVRELCPQDVITYFVIPSRCDGRSVKALSGFRSNNTGSVRGSTISFSDPSLRYQRVIRQSAQLGRHAIRKTAGLVASASPSLIQPHFEYLTPLIDEIHGWAKAWNLVERVGQPATWVLEVAVKQLEVWFFGTLRTGPVPAVHLRPPGSKGTTAPGTLPNTPDPPEGLLRYNPIFKSRDQYLVDLRLLALKSVERDPLLRRLEKSHVKALIERAPLTTALEYCDAVERCYEQANFRRCKANEKRELNRHLKWTVELFRPPTDNGPTSQTDIAKRSRVNTAAVSRAVNSILTIIGLRPPPHVRRGRRPVI